jgi:hypothetical protein
VISRRLVARERCLARPAASDVPSAWRPGCFTGGYTPARIGAVKLQNTVKPVLANTGTNPPGPQSAPSNLIGANGFAVGGRSLGWRGLCAVERRDRRERLRRRSPTAIRSSAPLDGSPALIGYRGAEDSRNGEQPPACGKRGQPARRRPPRPSALPRERARLSRRPGRGQTPPIPR